MSTASETISLATSLPVQTTQIAGTEGHQRFQETNPPHASILGLAVVATVVFIAIFAIFIVRRRDKLTRNASIDASMAQIADIEQQRGTAAALGHTNLGMHHQRMLRKSPLINVLNKPELRMLPKMSFSEYSAKNTVSISTDCCVICLEPFSADNEVRKLACKHIFHAGCIDKWLLRRSCRCPLCNADTRGLLGLPQLPSSVKLDII